MQEIVRAVNMSSLTNIASEKPRVFKKEQNDCRKSRRTVIDGVTSLPVLRNGQMALENHHVKITVDRGLLYLPLRW